jgi:hypothetical protein
MTGSSFPFTLVAVGSLTKVVTGVTLPLTLLGKYVTSGGDGGNVIPGGSLVGVALDELVYGHGGGNIVRTELRTLIPGG